MNMLISGGDVVDPVKGKVEKLDILIEDGRISKIYSPNDIIEKGTKLKVIDASGKIVIPGLIDMHVHLREPGEEYKETIASGSMAGAAGGFTGLACMPNTETVNDNSAVTEFILEQARKANILRVFPIAAITKGRKGRTLTEFGDLKRAGAVGITDDGSPVINSQVMRRALEYARYHNLTVISHCEDLFLSEGGVMNEGVISSRIGLKGIPSSSEEIMVERDISLARLTNCPVHIAHVSTKSSVKAIKRAKEDGVPVTAETAPHYFTLDHSSVIGYNTNFKINPPLRSLEDIQAIKRGLKENIIDVIATDHAPHSPLEKELEFDQAAFGIIGLETAVSLTMNLVREGVLSLSEAVKKLSFSPASILGVRGGYLEEGMPADIAVIDPEEEYVLKEEDILSKSKNSPFIGNTLKGRNILTMVEGRIVWSRDSQYINS